MQRSNYCVYKHTCVASGASYGKVYIGITCQKPEARWGAAGQNYKHCLYFDNAIKKYGWENFSHEILATGLYRSEAARLERKYIKQYHANDPQHGFNLTAGGDHLAGAECPTSRPVVAFDAVSGIRVSDYGSIAEAEREIGGSPESVLYGKAKTTQGLIIRYYDDVGATMILPESDRFVPRSQPGKERPISQYDLQGNYITSYKSASAAAAMTGISVDSIGNAVRLISKSAGGFQWRFDSPDHSNIGVYVSPHDVRKTNGGYKGKWIDQIDPHTGEVLNTYESIREATRAVNGNRWNISTAVKRADGKHTVNGYIWRLHKE